MDSKRATVQLRDKVGKKKNTVERDTVTQTDSIKIYLEL
jgi:hypothetical protein